MCETTPCSHRARGLEGIQLTPPLYRFLRDETVEPPPPKRTPAPRRNPKLYQPPLLCTSYTLTPLSNNEMMNVILAMAPCQRPSQKPALFAGPAKELALAVQPVSTKSANRTIPAPTSLLRMRTSRDFGVQTKVTVTSMN